jgi:4-hydroxyphenylacetate 3-monooxygenase
MLKNGKEYLEGLQDGRVIYIGGERVDDVTKHPGFEKAAKSFARIYDARFEPEFRETLTCVEDGERFATYFLKPRSVADLEKRTRSSEIIAELTFGMMGRSPDFVAGYITGAAMQPQIFDRGAKPFSSNVSNFYEYCRREDSFLVHAVAPPQGTRDKKIAQREAARVPSLAVTAEDDRGVTLNGMKMLATSAAFSNDIWIGNLLPLAEGHENESITCVIPTNAPGLSLWSRKPFGRYAVSEFDNYLSYHFDESDCVVVCQDVKVPWERVFTHNDIPLSRDIYFATPAHTLSNHQSAVRYAAKLKLLLGLARRITQSMGINVVPAVADDLGHLAALYGMIKGMIHGQIHDFEKVGDGFVNYNRHYMYSAIYFATQNYDQICAKVRELSGGSVLQMPADISVLENPATRALFEELWQTPGQSALDKFKLFKLAWDILGSDFAGRHLQYERFYMGPAFIVRGHASRECDWDSIERYTDDLLERYRPGPMLNRGSKSDVDTAGEWPVSKAAE